MLSFNIGLFAGAVMVLAAEICFNHFGFPPVVAALVAIAWGSAILSFAGYKRPEDWKRVCAGVATIPVMLMMLTIGINIAYSNPVGFWAIARNVGSYVAAVTAAACGIVYFSKCWRLRKNRQRVERGYRRLPRDFPYLS